MHTKDIEKIFEKLKTNLPELWDGKTCIQYMKENNSSQWRQMEWPGFYFQFMCENILSEDDFMRIPGPRYGNVEFDGLKNIPWDFKAHSYDILKKDTGKIPTNGFNETLLAIKEYREVGFIIVSGQSEYDDEIQSFKKWHDELKGGTSRYEIQRIERNAPSRRRKVSFKPTELIFVLLDENTILTCGKFQSGFRNSNGVARNPKVLLDLQNTSLKIYRFKF